MESKRWRPFEEARAYARSLGLRSQVEWKRWRKTGLRPSYIPAAPDRVYENVWKGWGDWLGTGNTDKRSREWRSFEDARVFVRSLGLKSHAEWAEFRAADKRPLDVPSVPSRTYRDEGWAGWADWLGIEDARPKRKRWRPFEEARGFASSLGLKSHYEWKAWAKGGVKPEDVPASPSNVYKNEWRGWADWLGYKNGQDDEGEER